jgi:hypothetical protein
VGVSNKYLMQIATRGGKRIPKVERFRRTYPWQAQKPGEGTRWVPEWERRAREAQQGAAPGSFGAIVPVRVLAPVEKHRRDDHNRRYVCHTGNLNNAEYRFWIGTQNPASRYAECRLCHEPAYTMLARMKHQQETGHTKALILAYDLLKLDARCLVCDNPTKLEYWGIPICSNSCKLEFAFQLGKKRHALNSALRIVRGVNPEYFAGDIGL